MFILDPTSGSNLLRTIGQALQTNGISGAIGAGIEALTAPTAGATDSTTVDAVRGGGADTPEVAGLMAKREGLVAKHTGVQNELTAKQQQCQECKTQAQAKQGEVTAKRGEIETLKTSTQPRIDMKNQESATHKANANVAKGKADLHGSQALQYNVKASQLEAAAAAASQSLDPMDLARAKQLSDQAGEMRNCEGIEIQAKADEEKTMKTETDASTKAQEEASELKQNMDNQVQQLESEAGALEQEVSDLNTKAAEAQGEVNNLNGQLRGIKNEINSVDREIAQARQRAQAQARQNRGFGTGGAGQNPTATNGGPQGGGGAGNQQGDDGQAESFLQAGLSNIKGAQKTFQMSAGMSNPWIMIGLRQTGMNFAYAAISALEAAKSIVVTSSTDLSFKISTALAQANGIKGLAQESLEIHKNEAKVVVKSISENNSISQTG